MRRRWHVVVQREDQVLQMGSKSGFKSADTLLKVLNLQGRTYTTRAFAARVTDSDPCGKSSLIITVSHWHELVYANGQIEIGDDQGKLVDLIVWRKGVRPKRKRAKKEEKHTHRTAPCGRKKKKEKHVHVRVSPSRR